MPAKAHAELKAGLAELRRRWFARWGGARSLRRGPIPATAIWVGCRRKRFEDFFCLTPIGVRVGYASPKLLLTLPSGERQRVRDRVVWASTSNAHYAIHGIRPGATVAAAGMHLKLGRPLHIGLNFWYLGPNGSSTAVLKVRHGIVEEIRIDDKQLTKGRTAQRAFMSSFF